MSANPSRPNITVDVDSAVSGPGAFIEVVTQDRSLLCRLLRCQCLEVRQSRAGARIEARGKEDEDVSKGCVLRWDLKEERHSFPLAQGWGRAIAQRRSTCCTCRRARGDQASPFPVKGSLAKGKVSSDLEGPVVRFRRWQMSRRSDLPGRFAVLLVILFLQSHPSQICPLKRAGWWVMQRPGAPSKSRG